MIVLKNFLIEKATVPEKQAKMRAQQLYKGIYKKNITSFDDLTTVTFELRKKLDNALSLELPKLLKKELAADQTIKFL